MLTIEEYIARRKKEDKINEFDIEARLQNIKICIDYVFEYFNNYIDITEAEEKTILHNEKLDKYRKQLTVYDLGIKEWLVNVYDKYGNQMNRNIGAIIKQNELFYLYDSDNEFRSVSYDCYSKLIKKYPFIQDQTEMLFLFIKDYHRVQSQQNMERNKPVISIAIDDWIEQTWDKHRVNLLLFANKWIVSFSNNEESWPRTHRKKGTGPFQEYEYDFKQKSNLFNLDSLYRKLPKKPFIKGKKQELEILMMYYWLYDIEGEKEGYWQEYLNQVLPIIEL